jgi:PAS domain S-box-containing protein
LENNLHREVLMAASVRIEATGRIKAAVGIKALGAFAAYDAHGQSLRLPTRKSRALLVYLALHPGRRFIRDCLAALLWGDQPDAQARQSLRQALSFLRGAAGDGVIVADSDWVACPAGCVDTDVRDFEQVAGLDTLDATEQADRIYAGDFLEGFELGQPGFDDWLGAERARLRDLHRRNLGSILIRRCRDGELSRAISAASALARIDPFDEEMQRTLMRLYVRQGRASQALAHFQQFSTFLRSELGVSPDGETMQLYDELCSDRAAPGALRTLADYAFVLEQQPFCLVVTDLTSRVVGWNRVAEEAFGFSKDFMYGQSPTLLYAPKRDPMLADGVFKRACEHGHWTHRVKLLSKDGREFEQTRTVTPLFDRSGALIGGFGTGMAEG